VTDPGGALRVASHPDPASQRNPYLRLLEREVARRGVRFEHIRGGLTPAWARGAAATADLVHLHWLEFLVASAGRTSGLRTHARAARLLAALRRLRRAGVGVVWTVHNLRPHESDYPWLDTLLARRVAREAGALIVHSLHARDRVREELGREQGVFVAPHGNYIGAYPEERRSRSEVREALGLPAGDWVYLIFGQVRAYKRIPEAIEAFRRLEMPDALLLVAGRAPREDDAQAVARAAAGDPRVVLRLEHVPDASVHAYHLAADAAVLTHAELFSSGALMLALSFGLPAVVPGEGSALEVAPAPAVEPYWGGRVGEALLAVREGDQGLRREAAITAAREATWERMADAVVAAYRAALRRPPRTSVQRRP
jgi:glycosyltransferase involved in cell wall biosynthesis